MLYMSNVPTPEGAPNNANIHPWRQRLLYGTVCLAATVSMSCGTTDAAIEQQPTTTQTTYEVEDIPTPEECIQPSAADIAEVERLFTATTDPELAEAASESKMGLDYADHQKIQSKQAQKLGMHLYSFADSGFFYERPGKGELTPEQDDASFNDVYASAKEFLMQYGVELKIGAVNPEVGARIPTNEELDAYSSIKDIQKIVETISTFPEEVIREFGLDQIVLAKFDSVVTETGTANSYGGYYEGKGVLVIGLSDSSPDMDGTVGLPPSRVGETLLHEMTHLIDAETLCGIDFTVDAKFRAITPETVKYAEDIGQETPELGGYLDSESANQYTGANEYEPAQQTATESLVVSVLPYSFTNVQEDKATLGPVLLQANSLANELNFGKDSPILREKYLYMASRLYAAMPQFVRYMAATSLHFNDLFEKTAYADSPTRK